MLCGLGEDSPEVREARAALMAGEQVQKILSRQEPGGYWGKPEDFYERSKYKGTVWNVILLAEMGADGSDERIRRACEFLLNWSQDRRKRGFCSHGERSGRTGGDADPLPDRQPGVEHAALWDGRG